MTRLEWKIERHRHRALQGYACHRGGVDRTHLCVLPPIDIVKRWNRFTLGHPDFYPHDRLIRANEIRKAMKLNLMPNSFW